MTALTPDEAKLLFERQGKEIRIPSRFTSIENYAFRELPITKIKIPRTIKYIGDEAFSSTELTSIDIPNSVAKIGVEPFAWSKISTISIGKVIESGFQQSTPGAPQLSQRVFYGIPLSKVVIKKGTKRIGRAAFYGGGNMDSSNLEIDIPDSVKIIDDFAFHRAPITSIKLPNKLKNIGSDAFAYTSLSTIKFPKTLKSIEPRAFLWTKLKTVDLQNVTDLGNKAFGESTLKKAYISPKLKRIQDKIYGSGEIHGEQFDYSVTLKIKSNKRPKQENQKQNLADVSKPKKHKSKYVDTIIDFKSFYDTDSSYDTLDIDADSFGVDKLSTFSSGKNSKAIKKLANQNFDFLYDRKKGGLYFNENGAGKGFGDGGIIAIIKGAPDLTSGNLEFI